MTSSILTNTGSMAALMTLRGINNNLSITQNRVSSGLMIGDASHNASVYSTAQTMRSDIGSYDVIARTLSVGVTNVGVALAATQKISAEIQTIREKITEAFSVEADSAALQADITQSLGQITTIGGAASYRGINMITNSDGRNFLASVDRSGSSLAANYININGANLVTTDGGALEQLNDFRIAGQVTATATDNTIVTGGAFANTQMTVNFAGITGSALLADGQSAGTLVFYSAGERKTVNILSTDTARGLAIKTSAVLDTATNAAAAGAPPIALVGPISKPVIAAIGAVPAAVITVEYEAVVPGDHNAGSYGLYIDWEASTNVQAGAKLTAAQRDGLVEYTQIKKAAPNQVLNIDVAKGMNVTDGFNLKFTLANVDYTVKVDGQGRPSNDTVLTANNNSITVVSLAQLNASLATASMFGAGLTSFGPTAANGWRLSLDSVTAERAWADVTNVTITNGTGKTSLDAKLGLIEEAYQTVNRASATLGATKVRLETQVSFVKEMSNLLATGLGVMVDADMTAEAARLKALQTQQQLATQALSIANNAPQTLLTLFR